MKHARDVSDRKMSSSSDRLSRKCSSSPLLDLSVLLTRAETVLRACTARPSPR